MRLPQLFLASIAVYPCLTEAYMQERIAQSAPGPSDACSSATRDVSTSATTTSKNATDANGDGECIADVDSHRHAAIDVSTIR